MIYRDQPIHVAGWAKRFLFRAEQLETAVGELSGGEQARVLIARLMLQPADVLLLDEPTNDLDIPTLEVLEESLLDFPGALVLVTHDRYLLDRVSTAVLGLDGEGGAQSFADYSQWEQAQIGSRKPKAAVAKPAPEAGAGNARTKRLSYLDSREWESMEERILRRRRRSKQEGARCRRRRPMRCGCRTLIRRCWRRRRRSTGCTRAGRSSKPSCSGAWMRLRVDRIRAGASCAAATKWSWAGGSSSSASFRSMAVRPASACHDPDKAFTDGRVVAEGAGGRQGTSEHADAGESRAGALAVLGRARGEPGEAGSGASREIQKR